MGSADCPALPSQLLSLTLPVGCRVRGWLGLIERLLSLGSHPSHWGTCSTHPPSRTPLGCLRGPSCTPSTGRSLATPLAPLSWCCMVVLEEEVRLSTADTSTQLCTGWFRWINGAVENPLHMLSLRTTTLRLWWVTLRGCGSTLASTPGLSLAAAGAAPSHSAMQSATLTVPVPCAVGRSCCSSTRTEPATSFRTSFSLTGNTSLRR